MGSTVQAPSPAPPMRPFRPRRSVAGPVVLIIIGVVFLLHSMGVLPWYDWGRWFAHYWPLLLILWGVIKLIEYQQANRAGVRPSGIGAGGFLLIIFLVIAGLSASQFYRWNWKGFEDWCDSSDSQDLPWCGHTYTFTDDQQQGFPAGDSLHVNNERGAVNITTSEDNQLHVTVHKRVRADHEMEANNWDKSTRPQISMNGQVVTVDANARGAGDHSVTSDLDIAVPRKAPVVVSTHHGDVSIMGRDGNADITSQDGDVAVTDLNGALTLSLDHSSARISQISSDVTIQGQANDVSLEDVKGAVRLNGDFMESVRLSRIAKPISFQTSRTEMSLARLDGDLNLDSGDLNATSASGPLRLRTSSKDIILNGVTGDVRVANENGTVEVHFNKVGNTEVSDRNSDIRLFFPEKASFQLEAQTRDGEIQSDFNSLNVSNNDDRSTASGSVNGGGPRVAINNEHGGIEIRSGGMAPTPPRPPQDPKHAESQESPQPSEN